MAEVAEKTQEQLDAEQLQKDVENFNAELIPLLAKYNVGLGATAFIVPDGRIGARPTLFRAPAPEKKPDETPAQPSAPATPPANGTATPAAPAGGALESSEA